MISKSDLLILVVASSALAVGIYRWHTNTQDVSAITIPASSRVAVVETAESVDAVNGSQLSNDSMLSTTVASTDNANSNPVVVQTITETEPVQAIVVETTTATSESQSLGVHQVQSGDYLGKIAQQYNTDVQTLRDLNGISGTIIQIGQDILYPL